MPGVTDGSVIVAVIGVGVALLAVLVPLLLSLAAGIRRELDHVRADVGRLDGRIDRLGGDLHALSDRVARIEGAITGPWRPPANGGSAPPTPDPVPAAPAGGDPATVSAR